MLGVPPQQHTQERQQQTPGTAAPPDHETAAVAAAQPSATAADGAHATATAAAAPAPPAASGSGLPSAAALASSTASWTQPEAAGAAAPAVAPAAAALDDEGAYYDDYEDEYEEDDNGVRTVDVPPPFVPRKLAPGEVEVPDPHDVAWYCVDGVLYDNATNQRIPETMPASGRKSAVSFTGTGGVRGKLSRPAPSRNRSGAAAAAAAAAAAGRPSSAAAAPAGASAAAATAAAAAAAAAGMSSPAAAAPAGEAAVAGTLSPSAAAAAAAATATAGAAAAQQPTKSEDQVKLEERYDGFNYVKYEIARGYRQAAAAAVDGLSNKMGEVTHKLTYCGLRAVPDRVTVHAAALLVLLQPTGHVDVMSTPSWSMHPQCKAATEAAAAAAQSVHQASLMSQQAVVPQLQRVQRSQRFKDLQPIDAEPEGRDAAVIAVRSVVNMYDEQDAAGEYHCHVLYSALCLLVGCVVCFKLVPFFNDESPPEENSSCYTHPAGGWLPVQCYE